jgi:hypothetical protein
VDTSGNAYVTGQTHSVNFPLMNPFQGVGGGTLSDAFVTKLNSSGSALLYSTYLGGSGVEQGTGIAVDNIGNAYVTGSTNSATDFPHTANAFQTANHSLTGLTNAFVTKLNTTLAGTASLVYSTYLGGTAADIAFAIAVDGSGNAYVTGSATSTNFPTLNPFQPTIAGPQSAFVTKLNPTLAGAASLVYSTYLGGTGSDRGAGIAVDTNGNAYVTGATGSVNFPTKNPIQVATGGGLSDAFVTKLNPALAGAASLIYSTYLGGLGTDVGNGIAVDSSGTAYVVGTTGSSNFPTLNALPGITSGFIFVSAVNPAGASLTYSTFLSGISGDAGLGIAAGFGNAFVTGQTISPSFPVVLPAIQPTLGGGAGNAFVSRIETSAPPASAALRFVPVTPCRIADTRNATGPFGAPAMAANEPRDFPLPAACGLPINASAYSLNMSVVPVGPLGFLAVWPNGQFQPNVATLNSDGRIKGNAAIVPAGLNGAITVLATQPTHLIIDVNGYFIPAVGVQNLAFYPVTPCRIADTRVANGAFGSPSLAANVARDFPVPLSPCGIPATAQAYAFNMTAVPPGVLGFLTTWPAGSPRPLVSTLNAPPGIVTANAAIVPAGVNGAISVFATQSTDLVIDINGYFAPPGAAGSLDFFTVTPCRILDTRDPAGALGGPVMGAGQIRSFPVPSSACGIPATAKAYSLNATVVPVTILGFLTLWGSGVKPFVATLNAGDGAITGNAALVPAGPAGEVTAFTTQSSHLIFDINGYFQ